MKAIRWLDKHHIKYDVITKTTLTKKKLKQILFVSEKGFEEILIAKEKASTAVIDIYNQFDIESLKTDELLEIVLQFPELLKTPIIFDERKLLIGYNNEEIRKFLPRTHLKKHN